MQVNKIKQMKRCVLLLSIIALGACTGKNNRSDAYGTFESTEVTVSAETAGRIMKLDAEEGNKVDEGNITVVIDTLDLYLKKLQVAAQRSAAETKLNNILSQIEVQKQQKKNLMVDKNRVENMLKEKAATQKQLDDINGSLSLLDKQITSIETQNISVAAEMKAYDAQLVQIQENIHKCYIRNPVAGTILTRYAEQGEIAYAGKALYKIADLNTMYLRVYISGSQLARVKLGQKVTVIIDDDNTSSEQLGGEVSWISSSSEFTPKIIQTREERVNLVYAMKVRVKNDQRLKIGMPGEILFK